MVVFGPNETVLVEPKTQTYHERVGLGRRAAGRRGGAEPGTVGHRRVERSRSQPSSLLPKASIKLW